MSKLLWRWRMVVAGVVCMFCGAAGAQDRPNILYIMTDDHAAHALSCYGS